MTKTIEEELQELRLRVEELERQVLPIIKEPIFPIEWDKDNRCTKCGLKLDRVTGYVCGHVDCPCGLGGAT